MAVTTESSAEYTLAVTTPGGKNDAPNYGGNLKQFRFTHTAAATGDANSTVDLIKVPAGKWTMYCPLAFIQWDAFGAARTLDIGWTAYNDNDGTAVAADADGIETDIDVSSAGQQAGLGDGVAAGAGRCISFDSRSGVVIQAKVIADTIPIGTKVSGFFILSGGGN